MGGLMGERTHKMENQRILDELKKFQMNYMYGEEIVKFIEELDKVSPIVKIEWAPSGEEWGEIQIYVKPKTINLKTAFELIGLASRLSLDGAGAKDIDSGLLKFWMLWD